MLVGQNRSFVIDHQMSEHIVISCDVPKLNARRDDLM